MRMGEELDRLVSVGDVWSGVAIGEEVGDLHHGAMVERLSEKVAKRFNR